MNLGFASWFFSFHGACYVHVYCTKFLLLSFLVGVDLLKFMFYWQLCKNDGKAHVQQLYFFMCFSEAEMVIRQHGRARILLSTLFTCPVRLIRRQYANNRNQRRIDSFQSILVYWFEVSLMTAFVVWSRWMAVPVFSNPHASETGRDATESTQHSGLRIETRCANTTWPAYLSWELRRSKASSCVASQYICF